MPSKRQTSLERRNALWKTPARRRALLWILLLIVSFVLPDPQRVPSTWLTAYNAGLDLGLVSWLAAATVWGLSRPGSPDSISALWGALASILAYATFPSVPHSWTFWAPLPWGHSLFWWGGIGSLMGAVGFFGLMGMGLTWLWRYLHPISRY